MSTLHIDVDELKPLIKEIVCEVVAQLEADNEQLGSRLGYTEPEAAAAIGVAPHVLADARRRGEVSARRVGKRYIYSRRTLLEFVEREADV